MEIKIGDRLELKKGHPCGGNRWEVMRVGMDLRLKCLACERQLLLPRRQVEKSVKEVFKTEGEEKQFFSGLSK